MNDPRDKALQDLLDHGGTPPAEPAAARNYAAYRQVYREAPAPYLDAEFARRITALAYGVEDGWGWGFWLSTALLVLAGVGASALVLAVALPPDSMVRVVAANLASRGANLAPLVNGSSVFVTFAVAFALDRWFSREAR
jgi:hypothetical protein